MRLLGVDYCWVSTKARTISLANSRTFRGPLARSAAAAVASSRDAADFRWKNSAAEDEGVFKAWSPRPWNKAPEDDIDSLISVLSCKYSPTFRDSDCRCPSSTMRVPDRVHLPFSHRWWLTRVTAGANLHVHCIPTRRLCRSRTRRRH